MPRLNNSGSGNIKEAAALLAAALPSTIFRATASDLLRFGPNLPRFAPASAAQKRRTRYHRCTAQRSVPGGLGLPPRTNRRAQHTCRPSPQGTPLRHKEAGLSGIATCLHRAQRWCEPPAPRPRARAALAEKQWPSGLQRPEGPLWLHRPGRMRRTPAPAATHAGQAAQGCQRCSCSIIV